MMRQFPSLGRRACSLLAITLLLVAGSASATPDPATAVALDLPPAGTTQAFEVVVPRAGGPLVLSLESVSLRAATFRVRVFANGTTTEVPAPPPATVRGRLRGEAGSLVAGTLTADGLSVLVARAGGETFRLRPARFDAPRAPREQHVLLEGAGWPEGLACGVADAAGSADSVQSGGAPEAARLRGAGAGPDSGERGAPGLGTRPAAPQWCGSTGMKLAQVAFDVDEPYYADHGSDLAAVIANVEGHLATVDAFYARDALITYELTDIIVRTTPFYPADRTMQGSLLVLFRDEWRANQTLVVRDIAHLMTGQPAQGLAGLAYVGVVCNSNWHYGWSVDSSGVVGHEIGHNWNAGHCHDVAPCNNMCGACLSIGPNTKNIIMAFRDSRGCLDDVGPRAVPTDPYAHPDERVLERAEAAARTSVPIDVLANDHDADCGDLRIASFDALTPHGARVSLDALGGPGGRDRLLYEPPCRPFSGEDVFAYVIDDGTGGTATTQVSVDVADPGLLALWPLDDGAGTTSLEATGWHRDATLVGGASWTTGRFGAALQVDGIDGHATVAALDLPQPPVTITGWVQRQGALDPWSGILFSRAAGTTAGLHVGPANDLRYTWEGAAASYNFGSGLVLPDGVWAFVALVLEPDRATLWLDDGTTWSSAVNVTPHGAQSFAGETSLGRDPNGGARYFRGALDELRVTSGALTEAELLAVRDGAGRAEAPSPPDGGFAAEPDVILSWRPAPTATEHDVYFGSDLGAVLAATPAEREYLGRVAAPTLDPPGLVAEGVTYAWRVDEVIGGVPVTGDAWLFTARGRSPRLSGAWHLDEGAGLSAADATPGARDAVLENGATWGTGPTGGPALLLDGMNDLARIPPLGLDSANVTFTAWLRTNGTPAPWAGIAFCRGAGTTAGLNFRDTAELGYHWNGSGATWGWSSGLVVPPDTWVFVALAVGPGQATLYLHDGAALLQATNVTNHGVEAFAADLVIGRDPLGAARSLGGELADVRVFTSTLTRDEILAVHDAPARASTPEPPDGVVLLAPPAGLGWIDGAGVTARELYVGQDLAAVRAATPASPEFRGSLPGTGWTPPAGLFASGAWYWRVDTSGPGGLTQGVTWRFTLFGDGGSSLRVTKSPSDEPRLSWLRADLADGTLVQRCEPLAGLPCTPSLIVTVDASAATWDDAAAAAAPVVWYRIAPSACLP